MVRRRVKVESEPVRLPRTAPCVAIDTETTGINVWTGARPFAVSACFEDGRTFYREWPVDPWTRLPRIPRRDLPAVREICCDPRTRKYFFNAKFDVLMLAAVGVDVPHETVEEVSFMARAVNNLEFSYRLKPLAKKYVEVDDDDEEALRKAVVRVRLLAKKLEWPRADDVEADYWMPRTLSVLEAAAFARHGGIDPRVCETYAIRDAERTMLLGKMYEVAMDELDVRRVYENEMDLWPTTLEMERHGVMVDPHRMDECRVECERKIEEAEAVLTEAAGAAFNVNSPKQLVRLLFEGKPLSLPVLKRTEKGQPKTDAEALAPHKKDPIVEAVFKLRANTQAVKLFFNKYEKLCEVQPDGLILHPGFRQWGTLTGRYSCTEPNLQQVSDPDTTNSLAAEYVVDIRQVFIPRPGKVWYCPDYSQIEVVIFADISGEPTMINAILAGHDIHAATAEKVWGGVDNPRAVVEAMKILRVDSRLAAIDELARFEWKICDLEVAHKQKTVRKRSKSVTFTKIFGGGPLALMRWIGVSKPEAVEILSTYDREFPTMVQRMREIELKGKKDGHVTNIFGVRLGVDPWHSYRAVNHVVQSSAASLMKRGMRATARYLRALRAGGLDARIIMTIHDELVFEFNRRHVSRPIVQRIRELMSDHGGAMSIPVKVDVERVGERWSDKSKVDA